MTVVTRDCAPLLTHDLYGIPSTRSVTDEGFLLCRDVPIGLVRIQRPEAEVFAPETVLSFIGRPVTNDHPDELVGPLTWKNHSVGTVINVRRGEGVSSDYLIADLLIGELETIEAINKGKVEVSAGYTADYEQIEPGRGVQRNIRGNHLALVDRGRCGPRCSIGDRDMTTKTKRSWKDKIMAAFKARDESALEEALGEADDPNVVVHVHNNTADEGGEDDPDKKKEKDIADSVKDIATAVKGIGDRLTSVEDAIKTRKTRDADEDEEERKRKEKEAATEDEEAKKMTGDDAGLATEFQDAVARAEILFPGIKLPAFDKQVTRKSTRDCICALRRDALSKAFDNAERKKFVKPFVADAPDFKAMTCDQAKTIFVGASELARAANNSGGNTKFTDARKETETVFDSIRRMNEENQKFWTRKAS